MFHYILINEFKDKRIGYILGIYNSEEEAKSRANVLFEYFAKCYYNDDEHISLSSFPKYDSYEITGDDYFPHSERYTERQSISNGNQTVSVIRYQGEFEHKRFVEYRNIPKYDGIEFN